MHALYPKGFTREDVQYTTLSNDKVMLLNYTSGTTGFSKGCDADRKQSCRQCHFRYSYRTP